MLVDTDREGLVDEDMLFLVDTIVPILDRRLSTH